MSHLALLLEPSVTCGDLLDVLLRRAGVVAVQALSTLEARSLLARVGFDVVVADAGTAAEPPGSAALARAAHMAGSGPLLALTDRHMVDEDEMRALDASAVVYKPFTPRGFEAVVAHLDVGSAMAMPLADE